jgi:Glycosyl hydrolase family 45
MRFLFLLLAGFLVFGCTYQATAEGLSSDISSSSVVLPSSSSPSSSSGTATVQLTMQRLPSARTTQYWDACKPHCSWSGKGGLQANSCDINGANIGHKDSDKSACDRNPGRAFACMNQAPWKGENTPWLSYGYVAMDAKDNDAKCGDCYMLEFDNGEHMVVMKINIGTLNEGAKFDLMIPGGGVGDFNALTKQVENSGVSNPDMGETYGGFRAECKNDVECVKRKCNEVFQNLPYLKAGCLWYADTLGNYIQSFDNPVVRYTKLDGCPAELKNKY